MAHINTRLTIQTLELISQRLCETAETLPKDFSRRPRSLKYVKYWKATECHQFLLYHGAVILKNGLNDEMYQNYLKLHVACRILIGRIKVSNSEKVNIAEKL